MKHLFIKLSMVLQFIIALMSHAGMIASPHSKYMLSSYQTDQADDPRAENSVSHIQTFGYCMKNSSKYVLIIAQLVLPYSQVKR